MFRTDSIAALGRLLLALIFILSGFGKIAAPEATQGVIASVGLPFPLPSYLVAVVVELLGGILLIVGLQTKFVSLALAAFTFATAIVFHSDFADQNNMIHFMKNISIIGGLLQVIAFGGGSLSLDARRLRTA